MTAFREWYNSLLVGFMLVYSIEPARASENEILNFVQQAHSSTINSMTGFYCRLTESEGANESPHPFVSPTVIEYWRRGDSVRIREHFKTHTVETACRGGEVRSLAPGPTINGRRSIAGSVTRSLGFFGYNDAWLAALITHFGVNQCVYNFDELLANQHKLNSAKEVFENGKKLIYVDLESGSIREELWFDPSVNYLVRKRMVTDRTGGGNARGGAEVIEFLEATAGQFFPARTRLLRVDDKGIVTPCKKITSIQNVALNADFSDADFELKFPEGADVFDSVRSRTFRVDAHGQWIADDSKRVPMSLPPTESRIRPTANDESPTSNVSWLIPLSLFMVAGGLLVRYLQRRRTNAVGPRGNN